VGNLGGDEKGGKKRSAPKPDKTWVNDHEDAPLGAEGTNKKHRYFM